MRRLLVLLALFAGVAVPAWGQVPVYVAPDVPTTVASGPTLLPWQIWRYNPVGPVYTLVFTAPGNPHIDGIHKMDRPGDWLISVEAPSNLGGALPSDAQPADVVRYNASTATYTLFFCGSALGIPAGVNLDGLYLEGGDKGDLIASFDVPVDIPPFTFEPSDLVRFHPTGGSGCGAWTLPAANPAFDASAAGSGVPRSTNVIGADGRRDTTSPPYFLLSTDAPADLLPSLGPTTYVAGQIARYNATASNFSLYDTLGGWPPGSLDDFSALANPGIVPPTITVSKATAPPGDLVISWSASCSEGGEDYGIYQGTIGSWYSHSAIVCTDAPPLLTEQITPAAGNKYYLVVPHNAAAEGSYGQSKNFPPPNDTERPAGGGACATPQVVTPCP